MKSLYEKIIRAIKSLFAAVAAIFVKGKPMPNDPIVKVKTPPIKLSGESAKIK